MSDNSDNQKAHIHDILSSPGSSMALLTVSVESEAVPVTNDRQTSRVGKATLPSPGAGFLPPARGRA